MTGILLIDKPSGPTSHDVVARLRRTSRERRIGHTGTLDPLATGLLPLVLGRATRLAAFLTTGDKTYEATIRLGSSTDTDDAAGRPIGPVSTDWPDRQAIESALDAFRGTFDQIPPTHSAKRIAGARAYDLARRDQPAVLAPVAVTVRRLDCLRHDANRLEIRVSATAGFYVRGLARDLGLRLGCGGHLEALRRTGSGSFDISSAIPLEQAERLGPDVAGHVIGAAEALPGLPAVEVTGLGLQRALHGNTLGPEHLAGGWNAAVLTETPGPGDLLGCPTPPRKVRVIGPEGQLVALAESRRGALHPVVVLG